MTTCFHPFPNTHWSLVEEAGSGSGDSRHEALTVLLSRYSPALRSYLRSIRRFPATQAEELLQAFIADKVLEDELFRHADQKRGRFRTFLLTSLNNFVNSYFRKVKRQPLQLSAVEFLPQAKEDPGDTEVEAAWARSLIREVLRAMENECLRIKRRDIWVVFEGRILRQMFQNQEPVSYAALASILKLKSPTQAANLLVTGKRMYSRLLRTAVAEYERDEQAIDDEITVLRRVLSGSAYVV